MAKSLRQRRHKARILAMQAIFQVDSLPAGTADAAELSAFRWVDYPVPEEEQEFACRIIAATIEHLEEIDALITERLVNWEFNRISPVSRAILRSGVAQLLYLKEEADAAVVIDEAILMGKQYDSQETTGFINGLLDDVRRMQRPMGSPPEAKKTPKLAEKIKIKKKR
jgi:transcription antitermination protein NusB